MGDEEHTEKKHKHSRAPSEYMEHKEHAHHKKHETAAWIFGVVAAVFAILFIVAVVTKGFSGAGAADTTATGKALTADEVKAKTLTYLQNLPSLQGQTVSVDSVQEDGGIYAIKLSVGGAPFDSYATKDGKFLFPSAMNMNEEVQEAAAQQPAATDVPKSDKPVIELFVMSHCPYGTQAEKGILPVVRTLGDKVDFKVKFVYYVMHGEKEVKEQLTQYCIQKDEPKKYLSYLACFLNDSAGQGSAEASTKCMNDLGINTAKVESCKTDTDKEFGVMASLNDQSTWLSGRFPLFNTDKAANEKYSVGGSPTLIINGVQSNAGRSASSYLSAICAAFNNAPAECNTQVDSATPGPGFGYDSTAAATAAGCGV